MGRVSHYLKTHTGLKPEDIWEVFIPEFHAAQIDLDKRTQLLADLLNTYKIIEEVINVKQYLSQVLCVK